MELNKPLLYHVSMDQSPNKAIALLERLAARQFLNENYPIHWIEKGGPQPWPPRSPDMNPLDYFLWKHLKSLVYKTPVQNEEDLRNRIVDSCLIIKKYTSGKLNFVTHDWLKHEKVEVMIAT
ncbi:hypothetical protein NQ318_001000 [Aromia moschata]|uniref:Uncharacterized protein n=1 Tax=Aromia moschata TaxID=1265417 RepID=A0AAV8ZGQ7_9CUCU|nr:hypothetical protein NQ318_001000 [Aromia moschata]